MRHLIFWVLLSCTGASPIGHDPALTETGWFTDTGGIDCQGKLDLTSPSDQAVGIYYRDELTVFVDDDNATYNIRLATSEGNEVPLRISWEGVKATLKPIDPMPAGADMVLQVTDCATTHFVQFTTSPYGRALTNEAQELIGNTYILDLAGATWVKPSQLAGILQLYFSTPILLGVQEANATKIDWTGTLGYINTFGEVVQDSQASMWNFSPADFTQQPYFQASAPFINLEYDDGADRFSIPVHNFFFEATLSASGTNFGGGKLSGLGDTRELGSLLLQPNNPAAMCELATGLGVDCIDCPDGLPYCLDMEAVSVDGTLVPNLTLQ